MQIHPYIHTSEIPRPTVRLLVNLANSSADISVYLWEGKRTNVLYRGRYDEMPGEFLLRTVESFAVKTIQTKYGHKSILRMDIEIS